MNWAKPTGDELLAVFSALASPHRIRIIAALIGGEMHVSQLAREIGLSRPLVHMHVRKLEDAGLIVGRHEVSSEGRAMRLLDLNAFALTVTPAVIAKAAKSLTDESLNTAKADKRR